MTANGDAPWIEICKTYRRSILSIQCGAAMGTGWIAATRRDGFIVATARHVVAAAIRDLTQVHLLAEGASTATLFDPRADHLIHSDETLDVAILLVNAPAPGPPLPLIHRIHQDPAQQWHAMAPLGLEVGWMGFPQSSLLAFEEPTVTFCQGFLSAVGNRAGHMIYCLDGNVSPGMSGAPVWDSAGNILGMVLKYVAALAAEDGVPQAGIAFPGLGLVVPVAYLIPALEKVHVYFHA